MYKNVFQGSHIVDVFSFMNDIVYCNWTIAKSATEKFCESTSIVLVMKGTPSTFQMKAPRQETGELLGLEQPYLVVQIYLKIEDSFCIEILVSCKSGFQRRIKVIRGDQEVYGTELFVAVACQPTDRIWTHLCVDLAGIVKTAWQDELKTIDTIVVRGSCEIRQIYTLHEWMIRDPLANTNWKRYHQLLPSHCRFNKQVKQHFISLSLVSLEDGPKQEKSTSASTVKRKRYPSYQTPCYDSLENMTDFKTKNVTLTEGKHTSVASPSTASAGEPLIINRNAGTSFKPSEAFFVKLPSDRGLFRIRSMSELDGEQYDCSTQDPVLQFLPGTASEDSLYQYMSTETRDFLQESLIEIEETRDFVKQMHQMLDVFMTGRAEKKRTTYFNQVIENSLFGTKEQSRQLPGHQQQTERDL